MGEKRKHSIDAGPGQVGDLSDVSLLEPPVMTATRERRFADLYSKAPDFRQLATLDPDFAAVVQGRDLDFNDPKAVMQLTKTLLKLDFGLKVELRDDRLCPPVANRHNYILWLKGLLDTSSYNEPGRKAIGLDIGTGASCIYPLLGCIQRPWSFIATDIDACSLECAAKNVQLNNLQSRIRIVGRNPQDKLIPLDDLEMDSIDFCMTNPPFYKSDDEMVKSAAQKSRPPFTACTGAKGEMVTDGGEVGFVDRILQESLVLRERVQWYTAMLGFLSSIVSFIEKLHEHQIDNFAVTEFVQGNKTRRWAVAWSFHPMRPAEAVARGTRAALSKNILPAVTEQGIARLPLPANIGDFADKVSGAIARLDLISWEWDRERLEGTGRAPDKVWGRAWRRRKKREMDGQQEQPQTTELDTCKCLFGFTVCLRVGRGDVVVECRWREGHDVALFESFRGFLKATIKEGSGA